MTLSLYYSPGTCAMAPHILLEDLGLPYEPIAIDVAKGENRTEPYLAIHRPGFVPVLLIDGKPLTEVVAILLHIAGRAPEAARLPARGSLAEARMLELMCWLTNTLHIAYACLWRPERFTSQASAATAISGEAKERIDQLNLEIEQRLRASRYGAGENYSIADPYLLVFFRWANRIGIDSHERYPAWTKWAAQMELRPAVQRVLTQENISLWR